MAWLMVVRVFITIVVWSWLFQLTTTGLATFHINNNTQTYVYPTQDPFEVRVEPYLITGWLVPVKFDANNQCKLLGNHTVFSAISSFSSSNSSSEKVLANLQLTRNLTGGNRIVAAIDARDAQTHGCLTVAHAGLAAFDLATSLAYNDGLSLQAVLYLINHNKRDRVPGVPYENYYYSRAIIFPYGRPAVIMSIMPVNYYQEVLARNNQSDTPVLVTLQEEAGPWNDVFLSGYYIAVVYILALINILFILYNSINSILMIRSGRQCPPQRIAVFTMAIIITLLHTIVLFNHIATPLYVCLQRILAALRNITTQVLLLLWHSILAGIQNSKRLKMVKILIWFNFTMISIWIIVFTVITIISNSQETRKGMDKAVFAMSSIQIIVIMLIVYYGLKFRLKRDILNISRETRNALDWISKQCAILFLSSVLVLIANIMIPLAIWRYGVAAEVARILLGYVGCVLYNFVLLLVLTSTGRDSQYHGSYLFCMLSKVIGDKTTRLMAFIRFSADRETHLLERSSMTAINAHKHLHHLEKTSQPVRSSIQLDENKTYRSTSSDHCIISTLHDNTH